MKKSNFLKPVHLFVFLAGWLGHVAAAPYGPDGRATQWVQPGGATVELRVFGDEHYARTETPAGYTVVRNAGDNAYYYAALSADGTKLVPTTTPADQPAPVGQPVHLDLPPARIREISAANQLIYDGGRNERWQQRVLDAREIPAGAIGGGGGALNKARAARVTGPKTGLTILVQFPNDPLTTAADPVTFPTDRDKIVRYCNSTGYVEDGNTGSVRDYFFDQSDGALTYTQLVTEIVTMPHPRNYYNFQDYPTNKVLRTNASRLLTTDAGNAVRNLRLDLSSLTLDASNRILATNVFFAGRDSGDPDGGLWPQQWNLGTAVNAGTTAAPAFIYNFQITNIPDAAPVIGTFCHENGHLLLDYPDLYDYDYDSSGVGDHCLMGGGNYNNGGKTPSPLNAYLKAIVGWSRVTNFTADDLATVSLPTTGNVAYRLRKPGSATEYFMVENRGDGDKWAAFSPDKGIAIWHIDESVAGNDFQQMTRASHYQVSLEQADGRFDLEKYRNFGDGGDLFDQASPQFSGTTTPDSNWWDGKASSIIAKVYGDIGASTFVSFGPLAPNTIVVDGPNGGESVFADATYSVSWRANITGNVKIELYKAGILQSVLAANEPNDRSFQWKVPASITQARDYTIKISSVTNAIAVSDSSDASFAVTDVQFPRDNVMPYGWFQPSDARSTWAVSDSEAYEGTHSLVSQKTGDGQSAAVAYRANFRAGVVSFYLKVSSEQKFDFARFYIDGEQQVFAAANSAKGLSGKTGWVSVSIPVAAGKHTFKWTYEKDDSYAGLQDKAWLDGVALPETTQEIAIVDDRGKNLVADQTTIAFPDLAVGSSSETRTLTIKNVGGGALVGLKVSKLGANPGGFTVQSLKTSVLDPGESTTFKIAFAPNQMGSLSAVVRIVSNDANENPFDINVTGTGLGLPKIGVYQPDGIKLKDGAAISFGHATVKSDGNTKTFTVKNSGSAKLSGLKVSKAGGNNSDFVVSPLGRTSLGPGATTTFKVTFHPTARDKRKAKFQILSNDKKTGPFDLTYTGTGAPKSSSSPAPASALAAAFARPAWGMASHQPPVTTVEVVQGQKYLALTVTKQAGVVGTVEVSPNLLDWFSGSKHTTLLIDDATTFKVRDNTPLTGGVKRYIRLK